MAVTANDLMRARQRYLKADLKAHPATLKETGETVYLVLSQSETAANGFPTYHMVKIVNGKWRCECKHGRRNGCVCLHSACAYDADTAAKLAESTKKFVESTEAQTTECAEQVQHDERDAQEQRDAERQAFRATYSDFFLGC